MIKKSTAVGVPGIPDAALNAISDENTRVVLRAIADGLNVRNGFAGNGDSAFLTKGDLSQNGIVGSLIADALNSAAKAGNGITPGQVPIIINALQTAIMETRLFKDLGDRVELIDKPGGIFDRLDATELVLKEETDQRVENDTAISESVNAIGVRVGESEAAIKEESTLRASADNALSETISTQYTSIGQSLALVQDRITTVANSVAAETQKTTQLQASVNGLSSAISTESEARASADGTLYAQTYIKLDVNGRVAGMGLANDGKVSDFIVRADRFSIASPTGTDANGNAITPTMPFIVVTTPAVLNGQAVPPGVYMNHAFMMKGSITAADIGFAQIEAAHIKVAQIEAAHIKVAQILNAHIGYGEIDTLKIAGNAITQSVVVTQGAFEQISSTVGKVGPFLVIDMGQFDSGMMSVLINCSFVVSRNSITTDAEFPSWIQWRVIQESTGWEIMGGGFSLPNVSTHHVVDFNVTRVPHGVNRFFLQVGGMDGYGGVYSLRLSALGAKR